MGPICLFAGAAQSPNVARLLTNMYAMLNDYYRIDIVAGHSKALDLNVPKSDVQTYTPSTIAGGTRALAQYARENDPAVLVQVTDPPIHGTVVGAVARATGIPAVYRYSGDRFYEYRVVRGRKRLIAFTLGAVLGRAPLALADEHLVFGPVGRRRLIARGVAAEDITVVPPSIHTEQYETAAAAPIDVPDDRSVFLFVGRLSRLKGKETLETAIPAVLNYRRDVHFVCVGPTNGGLDLPSQDLEHVNLVGRVPPDEVPKYMHAADLLIHPSLTEGIPRVLLESLATETPVLAREVGDVASATQNTFRTDAEFVKQLCRFEHLPVDAVEPFDRANLASRYREIFERFVETN